MRAVGRSAHARRPTVEAAPEGQETPEPVDHNSCFWEGLGRVNTAVHKLADLMAGHTVEGETGLEFFFFSLVFFHQKRQLLHLFVGLFSNPPHSNGPKQIKLGLKRNEQLCRLSFRSSYFTVSLQCLMPPLLEFFYSLFLPLYLARLFLVSRSLGSQCMVELKQSASRPHCAKQIRHTQSDPSGGAPFRPAHFRSAPLSASPPIFLLSYPISTYPPSYPKNIKVLQSLSKTCQPWWWSLVAPQLSRLSEMLRSRLGMKKQLVLQVAGAQAVVGRSVLVWSSTPCTCPSSPTVSWASRSRWGVHFRYYSR